MLLWSESDPEFEVDPQLVEQLATEMSDAEYEMKVAGLLNRAFLADVTVDPQARDVWKQARLALKQGDHYILVMIDQGVGDKLKRAGGNSGSECRLTTRCRRRTRPCDHHYGHYGVRR